MTFSGTKCDGANCGKIKGEANHWFKVWTGLAGISITNSEQYSMADFPACTPLDICGQDCLIRKVSELAGNLK